MAPMPLETSVSSPEQPPRRCVRRWWLALVLIGLALAGWWFGIELPERRTAAELKRQQAENAITIPDLNLDMVWIPPGEFLMGTPEQSSLARWWHGLREKIMHKPSLGDAGQPNERPTMWVTLTRSFWLGRTEVSQAQWTAVMGSNPSKFKGDDLPVEMVSWAETLEFCRKLTERERAANRLPAGYAYSLPNEAQWEYACRAGTTGDYAGDLDTMAWYKSNSGDTTHSVGKKQANKWGLVDMHGNVLEWCLDWLGDYRGGEVINPRGPIGGDYSAIRGGSFGSEYNGNTSARSAYRSDHFRRNHDYGVGFRLALTPATVVPSPPAAKE